MDALYNAFNGIKNLCSAIGSSFAKIWTNGTVQKTAELLLQILANILNTIGNIANAFANAWREGGKGDKIVQSIANAWNNVLGLIEAITRAFSNWWKTAPSLCKCNNKHYTDNKWLDRKINKHIKKNMG